MPVRSALAAARPLAVAVAVVVSSFAGISHFSPGAEAQSPAVRLSVNCTGNPETTKVTNASTQAITVHRIGSLDEPRAGEPFTVNRTIAPGASVTWQTGHAATSNKLSGSFIYDNDDPRDGAHVTTSVGTFTLTCGGVSNGPAPAPTATRRATSTPVRATSTPVRATSTPVRATSTPVRATNTPVRATNTPVRATSTPVRATSTPVRATNTPVRVTNTPVRATATPTKTATATKAAPSTAPTRVPRR